MARPKHSIGHPDCPHKTWGACDQAAKEAMGKCVALTGDKEPEPCRNWATSMIDDRGYCGKHAGSVLNRKLIAERASLRAADLNARIDHFIEQSALHPSVWDKLPAYIPA